ncbi:MAG: hypothetical protein IT395_00175 [Candidatus Omnitrophica bacterium]|nr:hypothetical protein [Candidatus Omnitrophota bacterium]
MDDIKDIVKKVFLDISSKTISEQKKLEETFEKVLKQNKISGAKISGFRDRHLFVDVDSSARLYQVNLIRNKILAELKSGSADIEKISFKIGKV